MKQTYQALGCAGNKTDWFCVENRSRRIGTSEFCAPRIISVYMRDLQGNKDWP